MRKILVESLKECPVSEHQVEIVERKGVGHPDYICDAVMEDISIALSKEYLSRYGMILHHNIDKGLLVAGQVEHRLGGGKVKEPIKIIIGDRATINVGADKIPVDDIAIKASKNWIRKNLRFVDPAKHVRYQVELKPGSQELGDIFRRSNGQLLPANDTSAAVGYAPLTETEKIVLKTERFLNSPSFKKRYAESGEDVKVMGFREKDSLHLTMAMPLLERYIDSEATYFSKKREMLAFIEDFLNHSSPFKISIYLNTLDKEGRGLGGMYLTVLGTSAEDADSGEVGRGNRINGVIALNRPMGTEAAAGKNPVSHVGKIYNIMTHKIANEIYQQVSGIREVYVWLCSQIGSPIDQPKICSAQLILETGVLLDSIENQVRTVIDAELANIGQFTKELAEGKYPVC